MKPGVFVVHTRAGSFGVTSGCLLWMALCVALSASQSDVNNATWNESHPILNDQALDDDDSRLGCIDWEGKPVADGEKYVPNRNDLCMMCTCENRYPIICTSVACSPPLDCNQAKLVSGTCCEYECLDGAKTNRTNAGKDPSSDDKENYTNLSLRLIASTVTSLLFLALLLFMVHRLRQRRMLLALRRFQARSGDDCINDDLGSDHNIPENFMSLECPPYTDPPPPYSPPKPPHILPGEQPPSYEEICLTENERRESRSVAGREGRCDPSRLVGRADTASDGPDRPATLGVRDGSHGSGLCQTFSSLNPAFGVEIEMPRCPATPPDGTSSQADILPAYASTDVVFPHATFSTMVTPPHGQVDGQPANAAAPTETANASGICVPSNIGMPTLTAFQRFSSLFKRDRSKWKTRTPPPRPLSDFNPPHYATLSRTQVSSHSPSSDIQTHTIVYCNNGQRNRVGNSYPSHCRTDRMRLSYDSARAAYELAAVSPSTSSHSSDSTTEPAQDGPHPSSSSFPTPPTPTTDGTSLSVSHGSHEKDNNGKRDSQRAERERPHPSQWVSPPSPSPNDSIQIQPSTDQTRPWLDGGANEAHAGLGRILDPCNADSGDPPSIQLERSSAVSNSPKQVVSSVDHSSPHGAVSGYRKACAPLPPHPPPGPPAPASVSQPPAAPKGSSTSSEGSALPPSPPLPLGQMRRSHSGTSQVSSFSVCSETGEKRLRDGRREADGVPLASDCQYPLHHPGLSQVRLRTGQAGPPNQALSDARPLASSLSARPTSFTTPDDKMSRSFPSTQPPAYSPGNQHSAVHVPLSKCPTASTGGTGKIPGLIGSNDHRADGHRKDGQKGIEPVDFSSTGEGLPGGKIFPPKPDGVPGAWPFATSQSGKPVADFQVIKHPLEEEGNDECKKVRKKRDKDRKSSLSLKHREASSPLHPGKGEVRTKHDLNGAKKQARSGSKTNRRAEKKRVVSFPQPCPAVDSSGQGLDDANSAFYGNADVYRSLASHTPHSSVYPVPLPPFHKPNDSPNRAQQHLSKDGSEVKRNSVPSSSKPLPEFVIGSYIPPPMHPPGLKHPSPQGKKKSSHRRPISSGGHKPPLGVGVASYHPRPKSYADKLHGSKQQDYGLEPAETAFDQAASEGKRIKSGFCQDLTLADQTGGGHVEVECAPDRRPLVRQHLSTHSHSLAGKGTHTDSHGTHGVDPANGMEPRMAPAPPSRRRSGLSQDLSFVNRSEIAPAKRPTKESCDTPAFLSLPHPALRDAGDCGIYGNGYVVQAFPARKAGDPGADRTGPGDRRCPARQGKTCREERSRRGSVEENDLVATSYV